MSPTRLALFCAVGCLAVRAQSPNEIGSLPPVVPDLTNPVYGRAVSGHLSGHQVPDFVMLATGAANGIPVQTAVLVTAPGIQRSAVVLPGVAGKLVRDLAIVPDGDPVRHRDALAFVSDQGLFVWTAGGATTRFGGAQWTSASRVAVGDVDGDGIQDAIGVMGNGQNLRCQALGDGPATWFVDTGAPIQDLMVCDLLAGANGSASQIVVAQAGQIRLWRGGRFVAQRTWSQPHTSSFLACLDDGLGGRRIAIAYLEGGLWKLDTLAGDLTTQTTLTLGQPVGGLTVVRHPDGSADGLVVNWATDDVPTEFPFDVANGAQGFGAGVDLPLSLGSNHATARAFRCDIEGDGDLDSIAMSDTAGLVVVRNGGVSDAVAVGGLGTDPTTYTLGEGHPQWANEVEILFFQMVRVEDAENNLLGLQLDPLCRGRNFTALDQPGGTYMQLPQGVSQFSGPIITCMRYVARTASGEVTRRGGIRPLIWWRTEEEKLKLLALTSGGPFPVPSHNHTGGVGGFIEPPAPPPPPDEEPPDGGDEDGTGGG